jgi:quinol-cytochrome oxidoreductase complex cytochrome b subunit
MFVLEAASGIMLLLYYVPTTAGAYASVLGVGHVVPYGFLVRNLHYWAGQAMVVLVFLHMIRVFVTRSFIHPRRLNWLIGLALLIGTVLVDFTGYLLVWDDRALWARAIAFSLVEETPIVGSAAAALLFGGSGVSDAAITRLYVWHVVLLPGIMTGLMAWHFWRIRRDGGISRPL